MTNTITPHDELNPSVCGLLFGRTVGLLVVLCLLTLACSPTAVAQTSSLLVQDRDAQTGRSGTAGRTQTETDMLNNSNSELHTLSMYTLQIPEPRKWQKNDLVHVLIRETSKINSKAEVSSDKEYGMEASLDMLPYDVLNDFVRNQMKLTTADLDTEQSFEGEGEYKRDDDFTARLTARVVDVLPNGHLVLEARTFIQTDDEEATMKLTGICDPDDVSPARTILSSDIFDLNVVKDHEGELRKNTTKGIFAKILDTIFAF